MQSLFYTTPMLSARLLWALGLGLFAVSFVTGTYLPSSHLYISLPSMVLILGTLAVFLFSGRTARIRGGALTLLLLFLFSSLTGWSVVADTLPSLLHGILMGIFGACAFLFTLDVFANAAGEKT